MDYTTILTKILEVLKASKKLPAIKHDVVHHIEMEGRPSTAKYRLLDSDTLAAAKKEFLEMERPGIFCRSNSS